MRPNKPSRKVIENGLERQYRRSVVSLMKDIEASEARRAAPLVRPAAPPPRPGACGECNGTGKQMRPNRTGAVVPQACGECNGTGKESPDVEA